MKLSNRVLGILILSWFILSFYGFYKYFFELQLTNVEIISNVSNFSWSLVNTKFKKDFFCYNKKCILESIPPFEYNLLIKKENYKVYSEKIVLWKNKKLNIFLEKDIKIELYKVESLDDTKKNIKLYNKIYDDNNYVFNHKNGYLYFKNINNNSITEISFSPRVNYIKNLSNNNFLIVSEFGSYNFNINNKKLDYFSLFWDYIKQKNNYIWIINFYDKVRKNNFWFDKNPWNLIVSYDIETKKKYILKNTSFEINRIYNLDNKIYIENNKWEIFKIKWY